MSPTSGRASERLGLAERMWKNRLLYLCLVPTFTLLLIFNYYPALSAFQKAFYRYDVGTKAEFIGLSHLLRLVRDPVIWKSAGNLLKLGLFGLAAGLIPPLIAAELIFHLRSERWRYYSRVIFVIPMVVPGVAISLIWRFMYGDAGPVSAFLELIGAESLIRGWLSDPHTVLYAIMFVGFPFITGLNLLIYYSGLANIPDSILDAAKIDGAGILSTIFRVHLPFLMSPARILSIMTVIAVVQGFERILIITGAGEGTGGGPGYASMVPGLYMYYQAFSFKRMGYACAIGLAMFVVLLVITMLQMKYMRSETEYVPE